MVVCVVVVVVVREGRLRGDFTCNGDILFSFLVFVLVVMAGPMGWC